LEDKDALGKGTHIHLKTARNKDADKIEILVGMSEDDACKILSGADGSVIHMARTPSGKH
jgi:hypothetical protein